MKNIISVMLFVLLALPASAAELEVFLSNQSETKTTQFAVTDEVYIEGMCAPASQDIVKIYITPDRTWETGDTLSDLSMGIEAFSAYSDGNIPIGRAHV